MDRADYARAQPHPAKADDSLRPLTEMGADRMRRGARGLLRLAGVPSALFTSPFARALSTAEILQAKAWPKLSISEADELRPDRPPAELLALLKAAARRHGRLSLLAIVGHEPHLSLAAGWLTASDERNLFELRKGGACWIAFPSGIAAGGGRLKWLATPKMLRQLA